MIDGDRSRELFTKLGSAITFGEMAVDGFFIVSGFLVVQSFQNSRSILDYLDKRCRRIYPGFFCCSIIVIGISPALDGSVASWRTQDYLKALLSIATLNWPDATAFPGLHFHSLNGAAWSISYEFKCYLMVVVLGVLGLYRKSMIFVSITIAFFLSHAAGWPTYVGPLAKLIGWPQLFIRMAGLFCAGTCFYLLNDTLRYRWRYILGAAMALLVCLPFSKLAEPCFALAGGYLIFAFAFGIHSKVLSSVNMRQDISYGTYLYAWPIAGCLVYFFKIGSPVLLFLLTLPTSMFAGLLSWHLIEKHFVRKDHIKRPPPRPTASHRSATYSAALEGDAEAQAQS